MPTSPSSEADGGFASSNNNNDAHEEEGGSPAIAVGADPTYAPISTARMVEWLPMPEVSEAAGTFAPEDVGSDEHAAELNSELRHFIYRHATTLAVAAAFALAHLILLVVRLTSSDGVTSTTEYVTLIGVPAVLLGAAAVEAAMLLRVAGPPTDTTARMRQVAAVVTVMALGFGLTRHAASVDVCLPFAIDADAIADVNATAQKARDRVEHCVNVIQPLVVLALAVATTVLHVFPAAVAPLAAWVIGTFFLGRALPTTVVADDPETPMTIGLSAALLVTLAVIFGGIAWLRHLATVSGFLASVELHRVSAVRRREQDQVDRLLATTLPDSVLMRIANTVALGGAAADADIDDDVDDATVLYADIANFTNWSSTRDASEVVEMLQVLVRAFDGHCAALGVEKVKTIGDCYWAVSGIPEYKPRHADAVVYLGLCLVAATEAANATHAKWGNAVAVRVGCHSGAVRGMLLGSDRLSYEPYGATCNIAQLAESKGVAGRVCITEACAHALQQDGQLVKLVSGYTPGGSGGPGDAASPLVPPGSTSSIGLSVSGAHHTTVEASAADGGEPVKLYLISRPTATSASAALLSRPSPMLMSTSPGLLAACDVNDPNERSADVFPDLLPSPAAQPGRIHGGLESPVASPTTTRPANSSRNGGANDFNDSGDTTAVMNVPGTVRNFSPPPQLRVTAGAAARLGRGADADDSASVQSGSGLVPGSVMGGFGLVSRDTAAAKEEKRLRRLKFAEQRMAVARRKQTELERTIAAAAAGMQHAVDDDDLSTATSGGGSRANFHRQQQSFVGTRDSANSDEHESDEQIEERKTSRKWHWLLAGLMTFADPATEDDFLLYASEQTRGLRIYSRSCLLILLIAIFIAQAIEGSKIAIALYALTGLAGLVALAMTIFDVFPYIEHAVMHLGGACFVLTLVFTSEASIVANSAAWAAVAMLPLMSFASPLYPTLVRVILFALVCVLAAIPMMLDDTAGVVEDSALVLALAAAVFCPVSLHRAESGLRLEYRERIGAQRAGAKIFDAKEQQVALLSSMVPMHVIPALVHWTNSGMDPALAISNDVPEAAIAFVRFEPPPRGRGDEEGGAGGITVIDPGSWLRRLHRLVDAALNRCLAAEKIKTIGDLVMLGGPFARNALDFDATCAAVADALYVTHSLIAASSIDGTVVTAGIHVGPVMAAVLGTQRLCFDVFGDTVNTASRVLSGLIKSNTCSGGGGRNRSGAALSATVMGLFRRNGLLLSDDGECVTFPAVHRRPALECVSLGAPLATEAKGKGTMMLHRVRTKIAGAGDAAGGGGALNATNL